MNFESELRSPSMRVDLRRVEDATDSGFTLALDPLGTLFRFPVLGKGDDAIGVSDRFSRGIGVGARDLRSQNDTPPDFRSSNWDKAPPSLLLLSAAPGDLADDFASPP
mmetsp:Transcript_21372/g.41484  ORF Transcript_21372/g.41484 Transcript_21372/m.41484 type:complete len:108 (-) Transcript_21372:1083-1406(-)